MLLNTILAIKQQNTCFKTNKAVFSQQEKTAFCKVQYIKKGLIGREGHARLFVN